MYHFKFINFLTAVFTCFFLQVNAQTLIMNEVSNGPSIGAGTKEYVEFVVVSNSVSYNCNNTTPPCIDIRGWIFDDNSGYHGANGVAAGAVRFSQDPLWSCIPLGTIILIYNAADKNPAIPADDISMNDGNCRIIAPVSGSLFEVNATTPGASACSYPSSGWSPATVSSWTSTALANTGDCARIVNLSGCEVFSVCYSSSNQNTQIYFSGSGSQRVFYFNGTDPTLQSNWTNGDASANPGDQTPGLPNNAANAAYIGQFNNNCMPITSLSVTATSVNAGCTCNGSATANASGSIAGYTYVWYDVNFNPIGQTNATATNLCAGIYHVIAKSHIGCTDTTSVTITSTSSSSISVNSQTICAGSTATLVAASSITSGNFLWSPGGQITSSISVSPNSTTTYTVSYTLSGCSTTGFATITVNAQPTLTVNSPFICVGETATLTASGATTYSWSNGSTSSSIFEPALSNSNYTVTGTINGCTDVKAASITVSPLPTVTVNSATICSGKSTTLTANGANNYVWNTGANTNSIIVSPATNTIYKVTGSISGCTNTASSNVSVNPSPTIGINSPNICAGQSATLVATGAADYTWNTGETTADIYPHPIITTIYSVTGTTSGCSTTATSTVTVSSNIALAVNSASICSGQSATLTASGANSYTWSNGSNSNPLIISPSATTIYSLTGNNSGCSGISTSTVFVGAIPNVTISANVTSGCPPLCVQFSNMSSDSITNWEWTFENDVTSSQTKPLHCFKESGLYSVSLNITSSNGCKKTTTATNMITVFEKPIADFSPSIDVTDIFDPTISFYNQSSNAISYSWNFGDVSTSTDINPTHTYSLEGTYTTTLTATNQYACKDTKTRDIVINGLFTFYAPNTFTPNNDLVNDVFLPVGLGWDPEKYVLVIYDRWGNNYFSSKETDKGWDGKTKNGAKTVPSDVYTWTVELTDLYGKEHKYIGHISVIK